MTDHDERRVEQMLRTAKTKADLEDLRLIEVYRVTNSYTTKIIGQIFGGQTPPAYPGKSFGADSKELRALLASPHGQGKSPSD